MVSSSQKLNLKFLTTICSSINHCERLSWHLTRQVSSHNPIDEATWGTKFTKHVNLHVQVHLINLHIQTKRSWKSNLIIQKKGSWNSSGPNSSSACLWLCMWKKLVLWGSKRAHAPSSLCVQDFKSPSWQGRDFVATHGWYFTFWSPSKVDLTWCSYHAVDLGAWAKFIIMTDSFFIGRSWS